MPYPDGDQRKNPLAAGLNPAGISGCGPVCRLLQNSANPKDGFGAANGICADGLDYRLPIPRQKCNRIFAGYIE
jgi:hypothetical protein